ncbi:MAG: hypothetical protein ABSB28_06745 [Candidatus Bathyarchaeia archaeon]
MNKSLIEAIGGTLAYIVLAIICGYWAWVSYLGFYDSFQRLVWNWDDFYFMVFAIFVSGLFVGMFGSIVSMVNSIRKEARKEQERQKLKGEIKKELEMEKQKKEAPT